MAVFEGVLIFTAAESAIPPDPIDTLSLMVEVQREVGRLKADELAEEVEEKASTLRAYPPLPPFPLKMPELLYDGEHKRRDSQGCGEEQRSETAGAKVGQGLRQLLSFVRRPCLID